jgi:hypothetical protein
VKRTRRDDEMNKMKKMQANNPGRCRLVHKWNGDLNKEGITIVLLDPDPHLFRIALWLTKVGCTGWVNLTEIGSKTTPWMEKYAAQIRSLTVEASAAECIKVLNGVTTDDNDLFFSYDESKLPW